MPSQFHNKHNTQKLGFDLSQQPEEAKKKEEKETSHNLTQQLRPRQKKEEYPKEYPKTENTARTL